MNEELTQKKSTPPEHEEELQPVPEDRLEQVAEALLFASGESVALVLLAKTLCVDLPAAQKVVERLAARYDEEERGIRIVRLEDRVRMTSRPVYYPYIARMVHSALADVKLTETQLETLAIIAYRQPVTKLEIEQIRGVRADAVVNRLVEYGMVEEKGRLKAPGRPILFGTTESFLHFFGLAGLEEMPHLAEAQAEKLHEPGVQLNLGDLDVLQDTGDEDEN